MDDVIHKKTDKQTFSRGTLGLEISHHPVKNQNLRRIGGFFLGLFTILASLIVFFIFLFRTIAIVNAHGPAMLMKQIPILLTTIGIALVIGLPILVSALRGWHAGITIFENGMTIRKSYRKQILFWKEITRLDSQIKAVEFAGSDVSEQYYIILENQHQKELVINNNLESMDKMVNQIRAFVLPLLYQHACQRFTEQKSLTFHKHLKADQHGLMIKDQSIPFTEFNQPRITNQKLILEHKSGSPKFSFRMSQSANLDLLRHLIAYPPG